MLEESQTPSASNSSCTFEFLPGYVPAGSLGRAEQPGDADAVQYPDRGGRANQAPSMGNHYARVGALPDHPVATHENGVVRAP